MPTIQTGNPGWDQNLSTLGNALFPDPSKIGQGYYYGSEARKAQIEAARLQDQLAALHTATGMQFGHQPNPVYRQGAFQTNIMQEPFGPGGSSPGSPPPNLSGVVAAPPAAPGQPVQPVQAASTLANTVATTPPAALGTGIVAGFENAATTGPGAEPTGSNGSVPQNGPGPVHPGSVTSAGGGGVTYAPAAAKDGTPAPLDFNFAQNAALMAQGGLSADVMKTVLPATIGNMVKNGQMPQQTGEKIAAFFGVPNMRVQEISNQGAAQVANIQGATQRATTAMTQAGENQRFGMPLQDIVDPNDPTKVMRVPLGQLQKPGGTPSYNPSAPAITAALAPTATQPGGPGTPTYEQPAFRAQREGTPTYQPSMGGPEATADNATAEYIDPTSSTPLRVFPAKFKDARVNKNWVQVPKTMEQWANVGASAAVNAPTEAAAQEIRDRYINYGRTQVPKADADEYFKHKVLINDALQTIFPPPAANAGNIKTNTKPAGASPDLEPILSDLAGQYVRNGPTNVRDNPVAAANAALQQMLQQGFINREQDRTATVYPWSTTSITRPDIKGNMVERFPIQLVDPSTHQPYSLGKGPTQIPMLRPMSSTPGMTPPAPSGAAPAATAAPFTTDIGAVPPGTPNGRTTVGGKPVEVRNGRVYQ